jgi:hypothetical protein
VVVDDVLTLDTTDMSRLRAPVMIVALRGLFDIAAVATTAVAGLATSDALTVGEIDPDPFFDFTQERPLIEIHHGEVRVIRWPATRIDIVRDRGGRRDLVVVTGTEPHLEWSTFARCLVTAARQLRCEAVLTVGAGAEARPHTRLPVVTGSTTNAELASSLGLPAPTYEGVTGVVGVLHAELERLRVPSISLRVGIPHYLINAEHPAAVSALQTHIAHVVGVRVAVDHRHEIERWRRLHDESVEADPQLVMYVRMLEQEHDRRAEDSIPTADDLGTEFERFLRSQRRDPEPPERPERPGEDAPDDD